MLCSEGDLSKSFAPRHNVINLLCLGSDFISVFVSEPNLFLKMCLHLFHFHELKYILILSLFHKPGLQRYNVRIRFRQGVTKIMLGKLAASQVLK